MPRPTIASIGLTIDDQQTTALEALFDLEGVAAPAGVVAATYIGQRYWNCLGAAGARLYIATAVGAPGTWVAATGV